MNSNSRAFENEAIPKEFIVRQTTVLATHRFLLAQDNIIFVLEKGEIDLFTFSYKTREDDGLKTAFQQVGESFLSYPAEFFPGPFQFISSYKTGDWLFPFSLVDSPLPMCVIAVAKENCEISLLNFSSLRQALPRSPTLQIMTMNQMQLWIQRLLSKDMGILRPPLPKALTLYESYFLEPGTFFINARLKEKGREKGIHLLFRKCVFSRTQNKDSPRKSAKTYSFE